MPNVSKIKINEILYDIKDSGAREQIAALTGGTAIEDQIAAHNTDSNAHENLQKSIKANETAISLILNGSDPNTIDGVNDLINYVNTHGAEVTGIKADIKVNSNAIDVIEADYLKNADKKELESSILSVQSQAVKNTNALQEHIGDDSHVSADDRVKWDAAIQTVTAAADSGLKATKSGTNVAIKIDDTLVWILDCGDAGLDNILDNLSPYENAELLFEDTLSGFVPDASGLCGVNLSPAPFSLTVGNRYVVVWDDKQYEVFGIDVSSILPGGVAIGDGSRYGLSGNGEPFAILAAGGVSIYAINNPEVSHTVSIYKITNNLKVIFPETLISTSEGEEFHYMTTESEIIAGRTYKVFIDGKPQQECEAFVVEDDSDFSGAIALGGPKSNYKFAIIFAVDNSGTKHILATTYRNPESCLMSLYEVVDPDRNLEELWPKADLNFSYVSYLGAYAFTAYPTFTPVAGETYTVIWDYAEYERTAFSFTAADGAQCVGIGNPVAAGQADNGDPFCVVYDATNGIILFCSFIEGKHNVGVYR